MRFIQKGGLTHRRRKEWVMRSIALYNRQGQRLLTLSEAGEKGYGSTDTLRQHLHRGKVKGHKIGQTWLVLEVSLHRPKSHARSRQRPKRKRKTG